MSLTPTDLAEAMALADGRCLRQSTKERKHYSDGPLNDDDIEGKRTFNLEDHLTSNTYCVDYVQVYETGEKFNLKSIQAEGLTQPLLFREKTGLGMRVPSKKFRVCDVKQCVGSRRHLDVMDVTTQKGLEMTMKDWVRYYENPNRDRLLNVISLEFSHTKLENYVESPTVVRQMDWVDSVWPRHLKESQAEATNLIDRMKYPKVQKYCLMSVKGCYTDFHIDFGGTSVWYHILHGEKVFWLIPPTDTNIRLYEDWILSGKQGDMFFGEQVPGCQRVNLVEGNTFMIPTGWIHAVFTPADSLVFGGNFLHSFSIPLQIKVLEVEDRTKVPGKFRYPFMGEILWYVIDRYVFCLTGKTFRTLSPAELKKKSEEAQKTTILSSPILKMDPTKTEVSPLLSPDVKDKMIVEKVNGHSSSTFDPYNSLSQILSPQAEAQVVAITTTTGLTIPAPASSNVSVTNLDRGQFEDLSSGHARSVSESVDLISSVPPTVMTPSAATTRSSPQTPPSAPLVSSFESPAIMPIATVQMTPPTTPRSTPAPPTPQNLSTSQIFQRSHSTPTTATAMLQTPQTTPMTALPQTAQITHTPQTAQITPMLQTPQTTPLAALSQSVEVTHVMDHSDGVQVPTETPLTVLHIPDVQEVTPVVDNDPQVTPNLTSPAPVKVPCSKYLTKTEIEGLKFLIRFLEEVPPQKAPLPKDIKEPQALLNEAKNLLREHETDDQELAVCGDPVIYWPGSIKPTKQRGPKPGSTKVPKIPKVPGEKPDKSSIRRRRTRCKKCEACTRQDCGECHFCKDMRKFGGMGRMKQSCISRQCMAPVLPNTAMCCICQKEERIKGQNEDEPTSLMECGICWEIVHPQCLQEKYENLDNEGTMNEDLPNSWECPKCCHDGKRGQLKPRVPKGVSKIGKSEHADDDVTVISMKQESENSIVKEEGIVGYAPYQDIKPRKTLHPLPLGNNEQRPRPPKPSDFFIDPEPLPKRRKTSDEPEPEPEPVDDGSVKFPKLAAERFVVRPAPLALPPNSQVEMTDGEMQELDRSIWMRVFRYLGPVDLFSCLQVCKTFDRWCIDRSLWRSIDLSDRKLSKFHLMGIVRRQPSTLTLAKCNISSKQLQWLLCRLPLLRILDLSYCSWSAVGALTAGSCPWLEKLKLDWVEGLGDDELRHLLTSASCHRPGVKDTGSRLRNMKELSLVGTDITGSAICYISQFLPQLVRLDLSHCPAVTTNSFDSPTKNPTFTQLNTVVLAGCRKLNSSILDFLHRLPGVKRVDLTGCSQITDAHIMLFNEANRSHPFRTLSGKILYRA